MSVGSCPLEAERYASVVSWQPATQRHGSHFYLRYLCLRGGANDPLFVDNNACCRLVTFSLCCFMYQYSAGGMDWSGRWKPDTEYRSNRGPPPPTGFPPLQNLFGLEAFARDFPPGVDRLPKEETNPPGYVCSIHLDFPPGRYFVTFLPGSNWHGVSSRGRSSSEKSHGYFRGFPPGGDNLSKNNSPSPGEELRLLRFYLHIVEVQGFTLHRGGIYTPDWHTMPGIKNQSGRARDRRAQGVVLAYIWGRC